jgi:serine/threonine protein kinase
MQEETPLAARGVCLLIVQCAQYTRAWLQLEAEIGKGNFGFVLKASTTDGGARARYSVAVKTLNPQASKRDMEDFIAEARVINDLHHPNVLSLVGVCMDRTPWLIITPFADFGDLRTCLRRAAELAPRFVTRTDDLLIIGSQVAAGMAYIAGRRILHRDLAARNCLVFAGGNVRVADFGLAIQLERGQTKYEIPKNSKLPLRWMPLESLVDMVFVSKGDVVRCRVRDDSCLLTTIARAQWSFGILLWELFTFGSERPYNETPTSGLITFLTDGERLEKPRGCNQVCRSRSCGTLPASHMPTIRMHTTSCCHVGLTSHLPDPSSLICRQIF